MFINLKINIHNLCTSTSRETLPYVPRSNQISEEHNYLCASIRPDPEEHKSPAKKKYVRTRAREPEQNLSFRERENRHERAVLISSVLTPVLTS
jgi:hypothetical protein